MVMGLFNNKYGKSALIVLVLGLILISCVDPFRLNVNRLDGNLLVEGIVTNDQGPFRVKLSKLVSNPTETNPETGAAVIIFDSEGNQIELFEGSPGEYASADQATFTGEVGRSYWVRIETLDGSVYQSDPEEMLPVPEIDTLYFERLVLPILTEAGNETERQFIKVKTRFRTLPNTSNYIRYDYRGVFNLVTPMPCMMGCAFFCYVSDTSEDFLNIFESTVPTSTEIELDVIDFELDKRFSSSYQLDLRQFSMTERAFTFWQGIEDQRNNSGTIFDATPNIILGNLRNVDDEDEQVMGYFMASAFDNERVRISLSDLNNLGFTTVDFYPECDLTPPAAVCINCLAFPGAGRDAIEIEW